MLSVDLPRISVGRGGDGLAPSEDATALLLPAAAGHGHSCCPSVPLSTAVRHTSRERFPVIVAPEASKEVWHEADSLSIIIQDATAEEAMDLMTAEEIEVLHADLFQRIMTRARETTPHLS